MKLFAKILIGLLVFGNMPAQDGCAYASTRDDSVHFSWADVLRVDPVFEYQAVNQEDCRQVADNGKTEALCRRAANGGYEQRRIVGYDVEYRYRGEIYMARTGSDPGDRLRVRVSVTPAE